MRTRLGIELTSSASRIVEVADRGRPWQSAAGETVVNSFAVWPALEHDAAAFDALRGKPAAVVVWGTASEHRQVEVGIGSYEQMRSEAVRALARDGVPARDIWTDIAPAGPPNGGRRRLVVSVAPAKPMAAAIRTLTDAGIRVRTVMTPAAALAAIARSRRAVSVPDTTEAYVALDETATCVALIRNGTLVGARDFEWGFRDERGDGKSCRRADIAERLGDDLAELFDACGDAGRVTQVCICGGLPELRSTTLPLIERFDVEVEILDSLSGIDGQRLPEPAEEFRERVSELRLAWVAAADWTTINLLRPERRRMSQAMLSRAAIVAGVAAGLGGGWSVARSDSWAVTVATAPGTTRSVTHASSPPRLMPPLPPLRDDTRLAGVEEPAAVKAAASPPTAPDPPSIMHEPAALVSATTAATADVDPPPTAIAAASTIRIEPPPIRHEPATIPPRIARSSTPHPLRVASPSPHAVADPLPFDAALSSILFSPDRQLAIIDGHVVGRGDTVRDATVVEISAAAVLLRDSQGRLRRLATGGTGR